MKNSLLVIGAGLSGAEAAWQAAQRGIPTELAEMRPYKKSPAHHTDFSPSWCAVILFEPLTWKMRSAF